MSGGRSSKFDQVVREALKALERRGVAPPTLETSRVLVREALEAVVERAQRGNRVRTPIGIFYVAHHAPKRIVMFGEPEAEARIGARKVLKFTAASHLRGVKR